MESSVCVFECVCVCVASLFFLSPPATTISSSTWLLTRMLWAGEEIVERDIFFRSVLNEILWNWSEWWMLWREKEKDVEFLLVLNFSVFRFDLDKQIARVLISNSHLLFQRRNSAIRFPVQDWANKSQQTHTQKKLSRALPPHTRLPHFLSLSPSQRNATTWKPSRQPPSLIASGRARKRAKWKGEGGAGSTHYCNKYNSF